MGWDRTPCKLPSGEQNVYLWRLRWSHFLYKSYIVQSETCHCADGHKLSRKPVGVAPPSDPKWETPHAGPMLYDGKGKCETLHQIIIHKKYHVTPWLERERDETSAALLPDYINMIIFRILQEKWPDIKKGCYFNWLDTSRKSTLHNHSYSLYGQDQCGFSSLKRGEQT